MVSVEWSSPRGLSTWTPFAITSAASGMSAVPFCASLTEEEAYVNARLVCLEMISNGTGTFVDCNVLASLGHLDAVAQAVEESGMREG